jgi:hypothetical protein
MTRRTPILATWLLQRFDVTPQNEALAGDLAEEYQDGRSTAWYWWQTWVGISVAITRDVREHKLLAVRAIATGSVLMRAQALLMNLFIRWFQFSGVMDWGHISSGVAALLNYILIALIFFNFGVVGWLVALTHRARPQSMVMALAITDIPVLIYEQIKQYYHPTSPIPFQWAYNLGLSCIAMMCVVAGGLAYRPRRSSPTRTDEISG